MKKGDIVYSGNIKCVYIGRKKGAYVVEMKVGRQVWHVSTLVRPTKRAPDVWESTPLQAFSHPETLATSQALSTPPTRG